jgi:DUF1680 family protein
LPTLFTLRLRYPAWSQDATVSVNDELIEIKAAPGSSITLDREWRSGDRVELRLPMHVRSVALPGDDHRIAFAYGPIVLAGRLGTEGLFPGADILRNERTSGQILDMPIEVPELVGPPEAVAENVERVDNGDSLVFQTTDIGVPSDVTLIPHHERYNLYWPVRDS